ncbi:uncharacterized protein F4812DRAFT_431709 [Daldinia caldariorum]|uniref:uncharacterized protein n=1 Tax=Daldinia caldariorum TaxID=326644 RepID=UPI0020086076|nr:uncharacterized protein F4812DRAFT_431709 [Daldinia caldariorum]KAI1467230.1 hypothetical protein F4812DRAFT_431709 [Daldinia caldariorum]
MAEVYCICVIAYMDGRSACPGSELSTSLEALDKRTRQLEAISQVTPPPPFVEITWDSLTWRVCRLSRLLPPVAALKKAPPLGNAASLSLLKCAIAAIAVENQIPWLEDDDVEEKEFLKLAAQWLYYFAGRRHVEIRKPSLKFEDVCSLALDLSLDAEPGVRWNRSSVPLPPRPLLYPPVNAQRSRCCGCCTCACHRHLRSRRDSSVSSGDSSRRSTCHGRWRALGWFRKLAFWRRKRIADDSLSSSGTIVDD